MTTTYNVRIYVIDVYKGKRTTTYWVQWSVAGTRRKQPFKTAALADSFRSELMSAARKGEAFDIETGRPVSMHRPAEPAPTSWYDHACAFVDLKWPDIAATTRVTHAEALTQATVLMLSTDQGMPDAQLLRHALTRWAFNTNLRGSDECPPRVKAALTWTAKHTRPVSDLAQTNVVALVLNGLGLKLDGTRAASSVVSRRRKIFQTAVEHAVERKLLPSNPVPAMKKKARQPPVAVDRRSVPNPIQARTLLMAIGEHRLGGPLVAYFGCMYYAAMRPEEVSALCKHHLDLPEIGWGTLYLDTAEPYAGKDWTDSGDNRDKRQLKQREPGTTRPVPCPPELTALIHAHLDQFGTSPDGHLFTGQRNRKAMPKDTVGRVWREARRAAFTPTVEESLLARRPYDLRHAAVSTWLNGGIPATTVAEWAGQSVDILHRIYAKCLDRGLAAFQKLIDTALGN